MFFESLLFRNPNRQLWNIKPVVSVMKLGAKERYVAPDEDDLYK